MPVISLAGGIDFPDFQERWPWRGGDLQTLRDTVRRVRVDLPPARPLSFALEDGTGDTVAGLLHPAPAFAAAPGGGAGAARLLVVLVHGLAGSADSVYIRRATARLQHQGHPVLRLHLRGAGPLAGFSRQRYHAGRSDDLRRVLNRLPGVLAADRRAGPGGWEMGGVVVVGYSLAGNQVLKLMGEPDLPEGVRGAVAVSAPIDLAATSRRFLLARNRLYHRWLLGVMKRQTLVIPPGVAPPGLLAADLRDAVRRARTLYEFDDGYVAPLHGWRDAPEYYRVNSARQFLLAIRRPTLVIHALDDPWIAPEPYLDFPWRDNPALLPLITRRGGHVGFHGPGGAWADECLLRFVAGL